MMISYRTSTLLVLLTIACSLTYGQNDYNYNHDSNTCEARVDLECSTSGSLWDGGSACSAVHGGFNGNNHNLNVMVKHHLRDSFRFLIMASHFNTDEMNRNGMSKLLSGYSDKMWNQGKSMMNYILQRGGRFSDPSYAKAFSLDLPSGQEEYSEVYALGSSLDMMKQEVEDAIVVYKHAANRNNHIGHGDVNVHDNNLHANGHLEQDGKYFSGTHDNSFDPWIAHFLEENYIKEYGNDVRQLAGYMNTLAKIVRKDNQRNMGLHLFDESLV